MQKIEGGHRFLIARLWIPEYGSAEDPDYLTEPWVLTPVERTLNTRKDARLRESPPCQEHETYGSPVRSGTVGRGTRAARWTR